MKPGEETAMFVTWIFKCRKHNSHTTIIKISKPQHLAQSFTYFFSFIFHNNPGRKVLLAHLTSQ